MNSLVDQIFEIRRGDTIFEDASPESFPRTATDDMWGIVTDEAVVGTKHRLRVEVSLRTPAGNVPVQEAWYMYR